MRANETIEAILAEIARELAEGIPLNGEQAMEETTAHHHARVEGDPDVTVKLRAHDAGVHSSVSHRPGMAEKDVDVLLIVHAHGILSGVPSGRSKPEAMLAAVEQALDELEAEMPKRRLAWRRSRAFATLRRELKLAAGVIAHGPERPGVSS